MSIEKDINQSKFRNEHQKVMINIIFTAGWINEQVKNILDSESITSQQFNILRILKGNQEPLSTLQIRERMLDKMSDTSRIVDRLVIKDLVKKKICISDKRMIDVSITKKGLKLLDRLDKMNENLDGIVSSLSEVESKSLNKLLDKIRD